AEILPPLFNGLPINQFNHPETLGGLPLNHQKSFITVYVGAGRYTKGGTYDKEFTLRVVRGAIRPHDFNMEADDLKNPQHYGRLTCGRTGPRDSLFVCLAYAEDAVILAEDTGPGEITDEEIIAMTNEYLDHALNLRNP
ncbi:hypothetical protein, partial [Tessaracoccus sp. OH4464_COT-324]|uniref:hypothetical protein n=1 Tax=Tessaracoccus sp. OH4464_COT-324 TaxID=2491059 RepID=UPI00131A0FEF